MQIVFRNRFAFPDLKPLRVWLAVLFTCLASFGNLGLATIYPVKLETLEKGFRIRSTNSIRFYVDYSARSLILPEAKLEDQQIRPEDVSFDSRDDGLVFKVGYAFTLTLSPDGKLLTLLRANANGDSTAGVTDDGRIPTLFYLSNAAPVQVAGLLTRLYPGLKVEVDERQRVIIVLLNPSDKAVVEALIKKLDAPRPQVMFEAEIIEINRSLTQQLGIDYTKLFNLNFKFIEGPTPTDSIGFGSFYRPSMSLEVGINMLRSNGAARTIARPRVATLDGLEARLNATQTQAIKTLGQSGAVSLTNITTGLNMRLLPKVAPDQTIESQLSIAVSSPTGFTSDGIPNYSTREANTTVRVRNGESIVIGGLIETRRSTSNSGIPGLMDIPILGELFKTTYIEERDTDLMIIVTPYIVGLPTEPVTPSAPTPTPQEP
jgi:general secretion pathway protein D